MAELLVRRLFHALITLAGITLLVFLLIHAAPGDPISYFIGKSEHGLTPETIAAIRKAHHLDDPLTVQYLHWARAALSLDFGQSFIDRRPVIDRILERLPNTVLLMLTAMLAAIAVGLPAGVLSAARPRSAFDRIVELIALGMFSLPSFWVALLLLDLFAVKWQILPLYGISGDNYASLPPAAQFLDRIRHMILPVIVLTYGQFAVFTRFSRAALLEVRGQDFVTVARAKGASETRVLLGHTLRNALVPLITLVGLSIPFLLSGSVIVETIFSWNGMGRLFYDSVMARDYPTIMGLTVLTAMVTLCAYLATDVLYSLVDPRIRLVGERK
ncbi:MAG: ABC transporter permease [Acidobacteriota bacterium]